LILKARRQNHGSSTEISCPFERAANGYRHYTEAGVQRLTLIKLGQAAGFTLSEMRQAIHAWETDQLSLREKEGYMLRKLEEIEAKITALNDMKTYITYKIDAMREARKIRNDN
jgi:MerR family transcriptional regulator, copper efflux regulator